jgi:sugar transferase (PEP-CTERM/EpsH1 system associated)
VQVIALNKQPGKDPRSFIRLWRALRSLSPSIVHSRNLAAVDCAPISRMAGVSAHVHGEHGWDVYDLHGKHPKYLRYRRWMRPFVDRYVAVSRDIERWLIDRVGVPANRVQQIYNGVDTEAFRPRDARYTLPAGLPFGNRESLILIGTVGRLQAVKDPLNLVRAFIALVKQDSDLRERLRLMMVGDGPLGAEVARELESAGVAHLAWLPGARDDIPALLQTLDLLVLPSLNEGISNVILEAMATCLPVVATSVGGNGELVVAGSTGELVSVSSPEALASSIRGYALDPTRRAKHGQAARERAVKHFSLDRMAGQYLSMYESLLNTRRQVA